MLSLQQKYQKEVVPILQQQLNMRNVMAVPRLEKIVVNAGIGKLVVANAQAKDKLIEQVGKILGLITGQKPQVRRAKKSISGFKLREGEIVGFRTTLHGRRMYDFLERLTHIAFPRTRDFRGIPLSHVDARGNLTIGFREHIVFPETVGEETKQLYGFEATIVPTTGNRGQAIALYRALGIPLQRTEHET